MTAASVGGKPEGKVGFRCAAYRGGCTNRVAHPLEICRTCRQEAAEYVEEHIDGPPDDFDKDRTLADHGYGECTDCDNGDDLLSLEQCDSCGRSEDYCGMEVSE